MRVTREHALANHERLLDVAAKLFRENGFDGIGVADLTKSAGLTHGCFYAHFSSKNDLMAQACRRAGESKVALWTSLLAETPDTALVEIVADYLSPSHRDTPGRGCAVAALGIDASRQGVAVQRAVTEIIQVQIEVLKALATGGSRKARRNRAWLIYSSMVGALLLARATNDIWLSNEILEVVAVQIRQTFGLKR